MSCEIFSRRVFSSSPRVERLADVLQLDEDEISRFSHLLQALKSGTPPHGGIALGKCP